MIASTIEEKEEISTHNEKEYITDNGKKLFHTEIKNIFDTSKNITIPISIRDKTQYILRTMQPGEELEYTRINGIMILPKTDIDIDPVKTSYYPLSEQLIISFMPGKELYEIDVYTEKIPSLVMAETSIKWSYNSEILKIKAVDGFKDKITIFFSYMPLTGTVFLEDTKNLENMNY